ncbi:MAG: Exodeoxyribonuclease V gamma chain [uncultured Nocardioidaceae bacterium]|uniref:RecBCD enzyme subunit RecC n=1 Tax=uncultured Nocardioidaceae bacterium TaxID=253824 RepID=A0A6J4MAQ0_9ACTN|nr:MAG: Exodeoxyribonuclease V gamma chain [uncultured Nocardioidaceae bacterium]
MSGLHVHRSERADALVEALAAVLGSAPADPFAPEVVAVPARGVERWLTQRLSARLGQSAVGGDGVCAAVNFPSPTRLFADAVAAGSGFELDDDPWAPGRLAWALLALIDSCADEPWCPVLSRHLRAQGPSRRMVAATHLARLFTSYGEQRPTLLQEWQGGGDTDGAGAALADDLRWQAGLWRRLRAELAVPSPAERLAAACAALAEQPWLIELPDRLSLFGPTRLTRGQVDVLAALARHRDVHLWLPHPSAVLWDRVAEGAGALPRRRADPTDPVPRHRLLASLGRDARELQHVLRPVAATDEYHPLDVPPETLLGRLQHLVHTDTPPPGPPLGGGPDRRPPLAPGDRSVQVHACHGRARQVEVLREVLLGLLAGDPTLEPRDVLVMCPDIESYAPLVSAAFGLADSDLPGAHPGHRLRVRLADRSLRQTNPLLAAISRLLELADSRVTASQVLDFAALPPVSRRFQLTDSDGERIREWVSTSGVRWGLDADARAPYSMERVRQNTWQAGLDRILLGVTMAEGEAGWVGLALPLDDVDSTSVDLAGRLAELVDRLAAVLAALSGQQPLHAWLDALAEALSELTAVSEADEWQLTQARRELADVAATAGEQAGSAVLSLGDVRTVLAERLAGRPTRANFRTGNLTMCSMVPMRSVPHRVVCLLGLDDGVFPRTSGVDGDDVLARDPVVGERDRRSEDRQLLLDAVLAAKEHLVVLYTGADERTNTKRPPAVPLGEVLDVIDATVRIQDGARARDEVVVQHPLQPFDDRNFTAGTLRSDGPFSFDRSALAGARAAAGERVDDPPFLAAALPTPEPQPVELDALIRFLEHPLRGFLRQRLGVHLPDEGEELDDALHAELDGLTSWSVGDRWLRARLAGADPDTCREAEWRRGALPPGALGERLLTAVALEAEKLVEAAAADQQGPARTLDVAVALPDEREVRGSVGSVHGQILSRVEYGGLKPKHRLRAWTQVLMLAASCPDESWRATTLGRSKAMLMRSTLAAPAPDQARATLAGLVDLYDRGRCEPLPLPLAASAEYADRRRSGADQATALEKARDAWKKAFEHDDADAAVVFGAEAPFEVYLQQPPLPQEQDDVLDEPESSRFAALATRLWLPLLAAENLAKP